MGKKLIKKIIYPFIIAMFFVTSCEVEKEVDNILVSPDLPLSISIEKPDTLLFNISSQFVIKTFELYEDSIKYAALNIESYQLKKYNLFFIYNPKSKGNKQMHLDVKAGPHKKRFSFILKVNN